jgi:hypothetical protein
MRIMRQPRASIPASATQPTHTCHVPSRHSPKAHVHAVCICFLVLYCARCPARLWPHRLELVREHLECVVIFSQHQLHLWVTLIRLEVSRRAANLQPTTAQHRTTRAPSASRINNKCASWVMTAAQHVKRKLYMSACYDMALKCCWCC